MSWDIFVQDIPSDAATVEDIPDTFVPKAIGSRSKIIAEIKEVVPFADFRPPPGERSKATGSRLK